MGLFTWGTAKAIFALGAGHAALEGRVLDAETNLPLHGASIAIPALNRQTGSDREGRYTLFELPQGTWPLVVRFIGHAPCSLHVQLSPGETISLDVALEADPIPLDPVRVERDRVSPRGPEIGEPTRPFQRGISVRELANDPRLAEPDAFLGLQTGGVSLNPESPQGVHVLGGASNETAYVLDGIPILNPYHVSGLFSSWNPDALEHLQIPTSLPEPGDPHALAGVVQGTTRSAGSSTNARGSVSTSQARCTLDGPLGLGTSTYLVSGRRGFPGTIFRKSEPTYLQGSSGDALAKLSFATNRGRVGLLGYSSQDRIETPIRPLASDSDAEEIPRHVFDWNSTSWGGNWAYHANGRDVHVQAWNAESRASAKWVAPQDPQDLATRRDNRGVSSTMDGALGSSRTTIGLRVEDETTAYALRVGASDSVAANFSSSIVVTSLSGEFTRDVAPHLELKVGSSIAEARTDFHWGPRLQLSWAPVKSIALSSYGTRTHQFTQSLRNPESVVGNIFPSDFAVAAIEGTIPVAESDIIGLGAEFHRDSFLQANLLLFARKTRQLVLVAPATGQPFASDELFPGEGQATGAAFDARLIHGKASFIAGYGFQRVRLRSDRSEYAPQHGATHNLETAASFRVTPTFSLRLVSSSLFGRRTTPVEGIFEWESHNLLDQGSEFVGVPLANSSALGTTRLPAYIRCDLGFRKHWDLSLSNHPMSFALFGTVTNVLGRTNVLTYARNPETGDLSTIEMRPRAPLVFGIDWTIE